MYECQVVFLSITLQMKESRRFKSVKKTRVVGVPIIKILEQPLQGYVGYVGEKEEPCETCPFSSGIYSFY